MSYVVSVPFGECGIFFGLIILALAAAFSLVTHFRFFDLVGGRNQ